MRMVREQMLCIISGDWSEGVAPVPAGALPDPLTALLRDVGVVHFASIALLPPRPGMPTGTAASLMLEIAIDEGIRPRDLLARLAYHPSGALWTIYGPHLQVPATLSAGARNAVLLEHLLAGLSVADGGFVGPRDRTVSQVLQERDLYIETSRHAAGLPATARKERASLAAAIAGWAHGKSRFRWAGEAAPKSFWRAGGGSAKFIYFGAIIGAAFVGAWLMGLAFGGLARLWADHGVALPSWIYATVGAALTTASTVAMEAVHAVIRLYVVLGLGAIAIALYALAISMLRTWSAPWRRWFAAVGRELDRPTDAWSARVTHVFGWLVVATVAVELSAALAYVLGDMEALRRAWTWFQLHRPGRLGALLIAFTAAFFALLLVLVVGLRSARDSEPTAQDGALTKYLKAFRRWLHRPSESDIQRAQQVHESIERCEAANAAGTAHIVSLTELRWPYAWSAWWTRLSLRFVTAFGYAFFTEGRLGDAPGIQFSHWHLIDRGRRLLFCANFDGTFGGYLDDFIKGPSTGTTLFWRWTELLPRQAAARGHPELTAARAFAPTRLLVCRGVKCELKFKVYARESMLPNLYRFVAADFTLEQKNRATALRDSLAGIRTDPKDDLIMRAIES